MMRGSTPALAQPVMLRQRLQAASRGALRRGQHQRGAAVGDARRRAGGDDAVVPFDLRETSAAACAAPRASSRGADVRRLRHVDRLALARSSSPARSRARSVRPSARPRPCAGSRARTASDSSRVMPYWRARTSAVSPMIRSDSGSLKAVAVHRVDELEVAHLVAPARVGGVDEIRHAAHRLDAAGQHAPPIRRAGCSARRDAIACSPDAHALLIVCAGAACGNAGAMGDLPRGIRARRRPGGRGRSGLPARRTGQAGALEGRAGGHGAEFRGWRSLNDAAVPADRRPGGAQESRRLAPSHRRR